MLQLAVIVRSRTSASAGVIVVVAGIVTACAFACSHDLDPYQTARRDTGAPPVDSAIDTGDDVPMVDTGDSTVLPDGNDGATDAPEEATDAGPPPPEVGCTVPGPPATVCIQTATFNLGAANTNVCPPSGCANEMPKVSVTVSRFHIDQHEVTVGQFRTWWNMSPRPWPVPNTTVIYSSGTKDLRWKNTWPSAPTVPSTGGDCFWKGATDGSNDDKPMNCVDWFSALAYCVHDGRRLLTEAEFELVASGGENRLFPWSAKDTEDDPVVPETVTCAHALHGTCSPATAPRDSTVWGRARWGTPSGEGVWNLAGSLAEWTMDGVLADWTTVAGAVDPITDPGTSTTAPRSVRGGSYLPLASKHDLRAAFRKSVNANTPDAQIGFRCAKRAP